jgi:hypothetical protein
MRAHHTTGIKDVSMRIHLLLSALALLSLAGGCCDSSQPLYTPETIKQGVDLAGTWEVYDAQLRKFDTESPITIESLGEGKFDARWSEKLPDWKPPRFEKHVVVLRTVELNGSLYLDIEATNPPVGSLAGMIAGRHEIALAHLKDDRLRFAFLDRQKIKACAANAHLLIAASQWGGVTLDEPTAGLQKFVAEHRDEIFQSPGEARRIAQPQAAD